MPKSHEAPSQNWDVNNFISQSAEINKQNKVKLDNYKTKTEAYKRIDATLSEYEAEGIDTSIYRKKLEEKVPEISIGEKLGVMGRNVGNDYVNSFAKAFGGTPELTHSQKMDEAKQDREEVINPISTIATEVMVDPTTYAPIPFVKGATKLAQFGKNAVVGGGTSGGLYTAKEYGDEDYKPIDSLIAAGFGGVLNGTIATALGRKIPKNTKEAIKDQTIKESDPIINETFEEKFIGDDSIVNKMMGKVEQPIEPKKESIFGFEKVEEKPDIFGFNKNSIEPNNIPDVKQVNENIRNQNFNTVEKKPNLHEQNNIELPLMQQKEELFPTKTLSTKLPDVLPTNRAEMEEVIKYAVKNNAEDEFLSKLPANANVDKAKEFLLNLKPQKQTDEIIPVSINKKQPIKIYNQDTLRDFEGITKAIGQNTSDVLDGVNTNTLGVRNAISRYVNGKATTKDYEILDTVERYMKHEGAKAKEHINTPKNIDDAMANNIDYETADKAGAIPFSNGSQTFGGGAVGGLESEFNERDYNNDGKHDYKDTLVGALIGAVGINVAKKIIPKAFKDKNINESTVGMFVAAKPTDKGAFSDIATKQTMREIDDSGANIKPFQQGKISHKLDEAINHPELFKKYPDLKNVFISKGKSNYFDGNNHIKIKDTEGITSDLRKQYDELEASIYKEAEELESKGLLTSKKEAEFEKKLSDFANEIRADETKTSIGPNKSTLLHEIQHVIQKKEGWAKGGNANEKDYQRLHGEQQSRATEARVNYAPEQRASEDWTKTLEKREGKYDEPIIHSSPTVAGGGVGATIGATNDLDGDGKITYKDILIGAGAGAGGTKLALKATDTVYGTKALTKLKKIANSDTIDAITGHKIYAKKGYMASREKMISSKNAKMEDFVQLHEQLKLLGDDARKGLHSYVSGETNVQLSPTLKKFADQYVTQIKNQGQELVDLGILDKAQYDKFKGRYLHRVYEKDLTKDVASVFRKGKTIQGVHTRGNEWTGTKAEFDKLTSEGKIGDFFSGKIEARKLNNGQYKFTQDWTPEQRAKWGEVEDIAYTLPETLMRMSEMAEHGKMLKNVAMQNEYLSDEAIDGFTQLQGKRFGALRDKYVPKDIADDITEFNRSLFGEEDGRIFSREVQEAFKTLSTFWKKSHTVYNPTAHVNNLLSNVTMQYLQGINPVRAINNARKGAIAHGKLGQFRQLTAKTLIGLTPEETTKLKALTLDDDLKLYIQAEKAGLFGRSKLNDILGQYQTPTNSRSKVPGSLKKIDDVTSNWYQGEDNIMRFSLLKSLTEDGKHFDEALKEVNNTIPDYTKPMSRLAKFGRKSMLTPFISWTYYSTPIILRQMKERPGRALSILGAMYGINQAMGINPYDKEDIPQQNFSMKRIPIYKNGKEITTIKVDRWMPHNEILSPYDFVKNLANGGAWKGGYEVLNNQNLYYGGKITYKEGTRKAYDIAKHGVQQITPDAIDKIWNLAESAILSKKKRKKHPVIQPRSTIQELFNMAGLNTLTYDKQNQKKKVMRERLK